MKIYKTSFVITVLLFVVSFSKSTFADEGLLFYAPFEQDAAPTVANGSAKPPYDKAIEITSGKHGNALSVVTGKTMLTYDGPGNAYSQAGTISFFWRPDADPSGKKVTILDASPLERTDYSRFMMLDYDKDHFKLFFSAGNLGGQNLASSSIKAVKDEWYHLALCWDQSRGLALYVNGKREMNFESPWIYDGPINGIGIGLRNRPQLHPYPVTFSESFDEFRIYDRWVDELAIDQLRQGKAPNLKKLNPNRMILQRRILSNWNDDNAAQMPQLRTDAGLHLQQIGIDDSEDVKASNWTLFNGERAESWPEDGGYSNSGQSLHIKMDGTQHFDVVQIFGAGHIGLFDEKNNRQLTEFRLGISPDTKTTVAKAGHAIKGGFDYPNFLTKVLSMPVTTDLLSLKRMPFMEGEEEQRAGGVYQVGLFNIKPYPSSFTPDWKRVMLRPANNDDYDGDSFKRIREAFYVTDQKALMATGSSSRGEFTFEAMRPVHIVGAAHTDPQGLGGIALNLKLKKRTKGFMRVQLMDPLTPTRFWTVADVHLSGESGPLRLLLDHRDIVLPPNIAPIISLTFSDDTVVDLSKSTARFQWQEVSKALPQHKHDQFERAKDIFRDISEARSWSTWRTVRGNYMLHYILETLRELSPNDDVIESYWGWINPGEQKPLVKLPEVPQDIPAWAVYLNNSVEELKKIPYWWIDHRRNDHGEYGATDGINDDTDLAADWVAMDFMRGPDSKLREAYREIADNGWNVTMRQTGLGHYTDTLHTYEDGMNAISQLALLDYGNPIHVERLMATVKHYETLLAINEAGHLHFRDNYYGWNYKPSDKKYFPYIKSNGTDYQSNALALQPAMMLGWYNGNTYSVDILRKWTDAMLPHSLIEKNGKKHFGGSNINWQTDESTSPSIGASYGFGFMDALCASWKFTGDAKYQEALKAAIDSEVNKYGYSRRTGTILDRYIDAAKDHGVKDKLLSYAENPLLWKESLHNDSYFQMDPLFMAWKYTNDLHYIEEATKLTLNDTIWELPMLTSAEQSTDRVWAPQRLVNRIALGGPAMLRNELFPKMAASWEHATGKIAPFVTSQNESHLTLWVQNLEEKETSVNLRLWNLDYGEYTIETGLDSNSNGDFDDNPKRETAELARFSKVPLTIPAKKLLLVKITQNKKLGDIRQRADLAVTADDAFYDPDSQILQIVVHNIGAKATGDYHIRISSGEKVLLQKQLSSLDAPTDLIPKTEGISLQVAPNADITVQVDAADSVAEITKENNQITLTPSALAAPGKVLPGRLPPK